MNTPPRKGLSFESPLLTLALLVAVAALALLLVRARSHAPAAAAAPATPAALPVSAPTPTNHNSATAHPALNPDERNTIAIYRRVSPSVVSVANKALVRAGFFSSQVYEVPQGAGSGCVWDRQGHIVSNYHVIHEADAITVTFSDGKSYDARVIGLAPDADLAVLKIEAPPSRLQPVVPGVSHELQVGQTVLAIGNPFGLDTSLSVGVISALGRSIAAMTERRIHDVIQTDAAINPGNSGGPLLDSAGRLIGVNTAILSPSGAYAGIGFAVPVDTVARIVPQLIARGRVRQAGLGVQLLPDHVAESAGLVGVGILAVPPGSAEAAGLTGIRRTPAGDLVLGDVIVGFDGRPVTCVDDLRVLLDACQPGTVVKVLLDRNGKQRTVPIKLTEVE